MGGLFIPNRTVHINATAARDLLWLVQRIHESSGIFLLRSLVWHIKKSDLVIFTDACLSGFGFWSPQHATAYHGPTLLSRHDDLIFFHEVYAVACAIHWACQRPSLPGHLVIRTNSMNTIDLFNTLRARHVYNKILKFVVEALMLHKVDMRVEHVSGQHSQIANTLSLGQLHKAQWI